MKPQTNMSTKDCYLPSEINDAKHLESKPRTCIENFLKKEKIERKNGTFVEKRDNHVIYKHLILATMFMSSRKRSYDFTCAHL